MAKGTGELMVRGELWRWAIEDHVFLMRAMALSDSKGVKVLRE